MGGDSNLVALLGFVELLGFLAVLGLTELLDLTRLLSLGGLLRLAGLFGLLRRCGDVPLYGALFARSTPVRLRWRRVRDGTLAADTLTLRHCDETIRAPIGVRWCGLTNWCMTLDTSPTGGASDPLIPSGAPALRARFLLSGFHRLPLRLRLGLE